jgi:uncharacterized protein (TIGR03435 family)
MIRTLLVVVVVGTQAPSHVRAQSESKPRLEFEVASVRLNNSDSRTITSNFPLGPGDVYGAKLGSLVATNLPLINYIAFAYKIKGNQMQYLSPQLPAWVTTERFDIQAKADGNRTKDEMRLMMQSLLADRFKLAVHTETRHVPVLALVLVKPGRTGPRLRPHVDEPPCPLSGPPVAPSAGQAPYAQTTADGFPLYCTAVLGQPSTTRGRLRYGARNVTMKTIAEYLSAPSGLGHTMVDQTGLQGTVDFTLEWEPERLGSPQAAPDTGRDVSSGPNFQSGLREQLGLKLETQKGDVEVILIDHVEHPSEN